MKAILFAVAVLSASVAATPKDNDGSRFVDDHVINFLEDLASRLPDPVDIDRLTYSFRFPVTDLLIVEAALENLFVEGLSNIVVHEMDFSLLASKLRYSIAVPRISASLGAAGAAVVLGGTEGRGTASGSLEITGVRAIGEARLYLGLTGVSIQYLHIDFGFDTIKSDLNVVILERDISETLNNVLNNVIPDFFDEWGVTLNELIAYALKVVITGRL